jgi:dolichyl-phosphate beta-glucosyltransferase
VIELSVVLPLPASQTAIGALMTAVRAALAELHCTTEVVVVDDGGDGSIGEAASRWRSQFDGFIVARHEQPRGRGAAARTGVLAARGRFIVVCDPELEVPLQNVSMILDSLRQGADVAIISRRVPGFEPLDERPFLERAAETTMLALSKIVLPLGVHDCLSGLRGFRNRAAKKVAERARVSGAAFGVEWIALAQFLGFQILECPIRYVRGPLLGNRGRRTGSLAHLLGDAWRTRKRLSATGDVGSVPPSELLHETSFVKLDRAALLTDRR